MPGLNWFLSCVYDLKTGEIIMFWQDNLSSSPPLFFSLPLWQVTDSEAAMARCHCRCLFKASQNIWKWKFQLLTKSNPTAWQLLQQVLVWAALVCVKGVPVSSLVDSSLVLLSSRMRPLQLRQWSRLRCLSSFCPPRSVIVGLQSYLWVCGIMADESLLRGIIFIICIYSLNHWTG